MKLKRLFINLTVSLLLVGQAPAYVWAEEAATPPAETQTTDPAPTTTDPTPTTDPAPVQTPASTTGPTEPTGVAPNWAFNDATGKWERTQLATFTWDPATGLWNSPLYYYDSKVGWYHVMNAQPMVAPGGSVVPALPAASSAASAPVSALDSSDPAAILASLFGGSVSNSNTGPYSQNQAGISNTNSTLLQILSDAIINNQNSATSITGDADINSNTNAGSATTGAASVVANLLNFLNSAWSWSAGGGLTTFMRNLWGDHNGDITLQPGSSTGGAGSLGCATCTGALGGSASNQTTGPGSDNDANVNNQSDLTVDNRPTAAINNDIDLLAMSGNANVSQNTNAGSATSGPATVDLNILNFINSAIGAGQSFLGLINIFGNLNGDILFPAGFLDSVAQSGQGGGGQSTASNSLTGPNSDNSANLSNQSDTNLTNAAQSSFDNNIQTAARSGTATIRDNTSAGSANTGSADTNSNIHNLFNTGIVGDNAVLVLVNVLGHWVGGIMNLGGGSSTSALLTGNATVSNLETGPGSDNDASVSNSSNTDINNAPRGTITNNIRAGAISGDATVAENTQAGNATTGDAKVATNVVNVFNSVLNLKKWFGVLVINVFGDWTGSVNQDTAAGDPGPVSGLNNSQASNQSQTTSSRLNSVKASSGGAASSGAQVKSGIQPGQGANSSQTRVLSANSLNQLKKARQQFPMLLLLGAGLTMLVAAALFSLERRQAKSRP